MHEKGKQPYVSVWNLKNHYYWEACWNSTSYYFLLVFMRLADAHTATAWVGDSSNWVNYTSTWQNVLLFLFCGFEFMMWTLKDSFEGHKWKEFLLLLYTLLSFFAFIYASRFFFIYFAFTKFSAIMMLMRFFKWKRISPVQSFVGMNVSLFIPFPLKRI